MKTFIPKLSSQMNPKAIILLTALKTSHAHRTQVKERILAGDSVKSGLQSNRPEQ